MSKKPVETRMDRFNSKYGTMNSEEIQKQLLYEIQENNIISEKIRSNTNTLIVWLVVMPIIAGIIIWVLANPMM